MQPAQDQPWGGLPGRAGGPVRRPAQAGPGQDAARHVPRGLVFDYPSIEDYLTPLYATGAPSNDGGYSNPAFDATIRQGGTAANQAAAIKEYQAAEDIIAKDMPVIPIWFRQNIFGYSTRMSDVNMDLFANVDVITLATK